MKILIAGCGKVGATLTEALSQSDYDITVIDQNQAVLAACMERYDIMAAPGNCASMNTLKDAGVETADLLISCTGSDESNLLCCMVAHALNPRLQTIARICNPEYVEQAYTMRDEFAISMVFNPELQAAEEIERLLKFPGFLKRDTFAKGRVEIVELKLDTKSPLCGAAMFNIGNIVKSKVLVCAVLRDGVAHMPSGQFVLEAGDRLFVTATPDNLSAMLKHLGIVTHKAKSVLIAGGGAVSYYLADCLQNSSMDVEIIESDPTRCRFLAEKLPKITVLQGDASDQELLKGDGIASADALISLTGLDELNMVISLYGNSLGVPQIVTKLSRMENTKITDNLPLGSVISPRKLCCNNILRYVRAMENQTGAAITIHSIADGQAEAIEFLLDTDEAFCSKPLRELRLKENILIACISRGEHVIIPSGNTVLQKGDNVVVVAGGGRAILQLRDIFA